MKGQLRRRFRRRFRLRIYRTAVIALAIFSLLVVAFFRCRPVMETFAHSRAVWLATQVANRTVAEVLVKHADLCRKMVQTTYNEQQVLSTLFVDTASVNTVRTAITGRVMEQMEPYSTISVGVPLGTLIGFDWISGWGPLVYFPMSVTATVVSEVTSSLEAVGMNQTNFRVMVHINIGLYVVTPGGRSSVSAEHSYPMAEAVILGEVPDTLTEVYGDDQTLLGKIFDYGTVE